MKDGRHLWRATVALSLVCLGAPAGAWARDGSLRFELETGVSGQRIDLASPLSRWQPRADWFFNPRLEEVRPGYYVLDVPVPWVPLLEYKFVVDGRWIPDPGNPARVADGLGGFNSVVETAFRESELLWPREDAVPWDVREVVVRDDAGFGRVVTILAPPERLRRGRRAAFVYFQDGNDYLARAHAANVLANLAVEDPRGPLLYGVLIPPRDRMREYRLSDEYAAFVARAVIGAAEEIQPCARLAVGASLGGLAAVHLALRYPNLFTAAFSQSGSFWVEEDGVRDLLRRRSRGRGRRTALFQDVGIFESTDMVLSNRRMRGAFGRAGHGIRYREISAPHDWVGWRNRLPEILRVFRSEVCGASRSRNRRISPISVRWPFENRHTAN